ncbi:hypothetical protein ACJX0J_006192 [Zea mays]
MNSNMSAVRLIHGLGQGEDIFGEEANASQAQAYHDFASLFTQIIRACLFGG